MQAVLTPGEAWPPPGLLLACPQGAWSKKVTPNIGVDLDIGIARRRVRVGVSGDVHGIARARAKGPVPKCASTTYASGNQLIGPRLRAASDPPGGRRSGGQRPATN